MAARKTTRRALRSTTVNVHDAKTHLSRLLKRVDRGEEVVIGRAGRPIARLVPYTPVVAIRVLGQAAGQITVGKEFDRLPAAVVGAFEKGAVFPRK